jgi:hypothetical protein
MRPVSSSQPASKVVFAWKYLIAWSDISINPEYRRGDLEARIKALNFVAVASLRPWFVSSAIAR